METIHVCYAIHDKTGHYCKFLGTSMYSLLKNTNSQVMVHVLCDDTLSVDNKRRLMDTANRFQQKIAFYDVSKRKEGADIARYMQHLPKKAEELHSLATWYRLVLWSILPKHVLKIIYLDADTVVHMDIYHLWNQPVGKGGLAAVGDSVLKCLRSGMNIFDYEKYFNAGVLLMERERFCLPDWNEKILWFIRHYPCLQFCDQDVLNYYYIDTYCPLDLHYNLLVQYERFQQKNIRDGIYHYAGKEISFIFEETYNELFSATLRKRFGAMPNFCNVCGQ